MAFFINNKQSLPILHDSRNARDAGDEHGTICTHGNQPGHCYIKDMKVNEKSYSRNYLTHEQLTRGANIQFQMSPVPNKQRGTTEKDVPYSLSFE